jgi:hypothetical protein
MYIHALRGRRNSKGPSRSKMNWILFGTECKEFGSYFVRVIRLSLTESSTVRTGQLKFLSVQACERIITTFYILQ